MVPNGLDVREGATGGGLGSPGKWEETFVGPPGVGNLVRIDPTGPLDPDSLVTRVRALVEARDQHG